MVARHLDYNADMPTSRLRTREIETETDGRKVRTRRLKMRGMKGRDSEREKGRWREREDSLPPHSYSSPSKSLCSARLCLLSGLTGRGVEPSGTPEPCHNVSAGRHS